MARPRRAVQSLQEAVQVQPQAAPAGGRETTAGGIDLPIFDFAPISDTLTAYLKENARKDHEKRIQAGERFAVEHPELVKDIEGDLATVKDAKERAQKAKEAFAFLQRNGEIVAPADPFWQVGYSRAAGRQLAGGYRDRLLARMNEVSAVRDPQTGQVQAAPDLDAIMGEEWEKIQNSPAVTNFYGGQVALDTKAQVDEEFRTEAAKRRAAAQERDYQDMTSQEIGARFDQALQLNSVVTSETLQPITDFLTEEIRGHNVMDPRGLAMKAVELSIRRLESVDPDEALRAVHAAQDLVVGDVRLGDDRGEVGLRLQELTRQVTERSKESAFDDIRLEDGRRKRAIQQAELKYIPLLVKAKQEGQSVTEVSRRLSEEFLAADAPYGAFVVDSMQDYARSLDSTRASDGALLDQFNKLVAQGDLDSAESLSLAGLGDGRLTGEDYGRAHELLGQRRDVSPFVEQNGLYNAIKGRYSDLKPSGFVPEVQQRVDEEVLALQTRMTRDYAALVRTTAGKPNREEAHRAWLEERWGADQVALQAIAKDTRVKRDELVRDTRQRFARFQDAAELIDQGEQAGTLTVLEAQGLREQNAEAVTGRNRWYDTDEYKAAEREMDRQVQALVGANAPGPEDLAVLDYAKGELRDRLSAAMDDIVGNASVDPRSFDARARSETRRIQRELTEELFPSAVGKGTRTGLEGGQSATEAQEQARAIDADRARGELWYDLVSDPSGRERLTGKMFDQVPGVEPRFYDAAAEWMSGVDPILGRPTTRDDVQDYAWHALQANPDPKAVGSVLSVLGVDPLDVVRGKAVVRMSDGHREAAQKELAAREGFAQSLFLDARVKAEIEAEQGQLRALLQDIELPLEGVTLNPYTTPFFRSEEAMSAFTQDPAYPEFLRRLGIDPEDDDEVRAWGVQQLNNISRTNP